MPLIKIRRTISISPTTLKRDSRYSVGHGLTSSVIANGIRIAAPIEIEGSGTSTLDDHPDIFVANVASLTNCKNREGANVEYPKPGKVVVRGKSDAPNEPPTGTDCDKKINGSGGGGPMGPSPTGTGKTPVPSPSPATTAPPPTPGSGDTYKVVAGDTCISVAMKFGTSADKIISENKL